MKQVLAAIVFLAGLVPCLYVLGIWFYVASTVGVRQGIRELYPPGEWLAIVITIVAPVGGIALMVAAISSMSPRE